MRLWLAAEYLAVMERILSTVHQEAQAFLETGLPSQETGCQQHKARAAPSCFYTICLPVPAQQAQGEETPS